jgi:hypothetical protein
MLFALRHVQVTILFVNLVMDKATRYATQVTMQGCFDVIYDNCKRMGGCVSKIFLFDKVDSLGTF